MMEEVFPANHNVEISFLGLQVFQVLFLWLHDWVPLGRLNDVAAVRTQDTTLRLIIVTLIQSVPPPSVSCSAPCTLGDRTLIGYTCGFGSAMA